jgi:hypothetical protein
MPGYIAESNFLILMETFLLNEKILKNIFTNIVLYLKTWLFTILIQGHNNQSLCQVKNNSNKNIQNLTNYIEAFCYIKSKM